MQAYVRYARRRTKHSMTQQQFRRLRNLTFDVLETSFLINLIFNVLETSFLMCCCCKDRFTGDILLVAFTLLGYRLAQKGSITYHTTEKNQPSHILIEFWHILQHTIWLVWWWHYSQFECSRPKWPKYVTYSDNGTIMKRLEILG